MRVEKGTALAGFGFVAATIANVVTESAGPDITKHASQVASKIASDRPDVLINSALHVAMGISVLFFAAGLATLAARRGGLRMMPLVTLGAGVATAAAALSSAVLSAAVASSIHSLSDSQLPYLLYRGARASDLISTIFFALTILTAIIGLTRVELVSAPKARIGLVVTVVLLAGGFDYLAPDTGPLSVVQPIGGTLALIYVAIVCIGLLGASSTRDPDHLDVSSGAAAVRA